MAKPQTPTFAQELADMPIPFEMLTGIQRAYIDWKALDGIVTDDDGVHEVPLWKLGEMLRPDHPIDKSTLSKSCKNVPNFWDLVTERRKMFNNTSRLAYVHKQWYIKAALVKDWRVTEAWLRNHDPTFKESKAKVEHEMSDSWLELMRGKKQLDKDNAIEGEVVDGTA